MTYFMIIVILFLAFYFVNSIATERINKNKELIKNHEREKQERLEKAKRIANFYRDSAETRYHKMKYKDEDYYDVLLTVLNPVDFERESDLMREIELKKKLQKL